MFWMKNLFTSAETASIFIQKNHAVKEMNSDLW